MIPVCSVLGAHHPETIHVTDRYANNRAEQSHEATRVRERGMKRFKSMIQIQRFVTAHAAVSNLFNLGRHLVRAQHYRDLRMNAFSEPSTGVAVQVEGDSAKS
jgi:putative transposase